MKSFALGVAAITVAALSTPASAVTQIRFTNGSAAAPGYVTNFATYEDFTPSNPNQFPNGVFRDFNSATGVNGSTSGNVRIYRQSQSGNAADPGFGTGPFLSILNGGSYTATFGGSGVQVVSFILGTLDAYNSVRVNYFGGGFDTYTGGQIIGLAANAANQQRGRVTYDRGGLAGIVSVVFSSTGNSMEIDEITTAAPEPGTWGMMIVGFGLAGGALRMRRRTKGLATA